MQRLALLGIAKALDSVSDDNDWRKHKDLEFMPR